MKNMNKAVYMPAFLVFLSLLSIVLISFYTSRASVQRERQESLVTNVEAVEEKIIKEFELFDEKLRSGIGLFLVEDSVSREEWRTFINSSGTLKRFPGAQALGYTEVVEASELQSFTAFAQDEYKPDFEIYPFKQRDIYAVITLSQPETARNERAIGYDMYSEEYRRTSMNLARDTGDSQITDIVLLVQEDEANIQPAFIMYTPHYATGTEFESVQERREEIEGFVFAVFRSTFFLENLFIDRSANEELDFRITAGNNFSEELFVTSEFDNKANLQDYVSYVDLPGMQWKVNYRYNNSDLIASSSNNRPKNILLFGSLAAILITFVVYLLLRAKTNQLLLEQERYVNEAKDSLLSIASHQLRTPATGVKQYVGMLLQGFAGDLSPTQETLLQKAYGSNERQLKTINDVLYLAKFDSGRIVLSKKRVELTSLINSIIDECNEEITRNKHKIKTTFPKKNVYTKVDPHMFRMIIENLLTNAIKYTKTKGKIEILLKSKKDVVQLEVNDNGIGIDEEDYSKIFEQFTRLPNELSKTAPGTGIGLYLTKHLVELHGGTITVVSELHKGSSFKVEIPK